jgi:hypothetical protein
MKQILTLKTGDGRRVRIILDNRSSGLDETQRRWTLENPYWRCIDNGELAEQSGAVSTAG